MSSDVVETFNALVGDLDYPMFIVTAAAGDDRAGCLIGFGSQTSIDPPRFLTALSRSNRTHDIASRADLLGVHFVPAEAAGLAELFGGVSGYDEDKFDQVAWHAGPEGTPLLDACANRFVGRILERFDVGDHEGFLLEPVAAEKGTSSEEFTFHRAKRIEAGREA